MLTSSFPFPPDSFVGVVARVLNVCALLCLCFLLTLVGGGAFVAPAFIVIIFIHFCNELLFPRGKKTDVTVLCHHLVIIPVPDVVVCEDKEDKEHEERIKHARQRRPLRYFGHLSVVGCESHQRRVPEISVAIPPRHGE